MITSQVKSELLEIDYQRFAGYKEMYYFLAFDDHVCYGCEQIESADDIFTRNDFLALCNNNEEIAARIFFLCEWQHPSTVLEEEIVEGEIERCKPCGAVYLPNRCNQCPDCPALLPQCDIEPAIKKIIITIKGGLVSGVFSDFDDEFKLEFLDYDLPKNSCSKIEEEAFRELSTRLIDEMKTMKQVY